MKIRNIVFILYLFLVQYGNTQSFEEVNPSDVGFIEERLSRIDSIITKSINNGVSFSTKNRAGVPRP